ncbi:alkaline phosphatase D family protein [Motilibacter aurantiacus]|uniref:alkaline phosphatase D family protein n=1 Tax=Motilibacter aurantiacus TaxID=2714955 RepID=UPI00140AB818|nr:alkaline phosphatase D family protein [Motilibacter aurantiacus]NHC44005.1 alkaline phosphatase [Motilibacter aurantiacus]
MATTPISRRAVILGGAAVGAGAAAGGLLPGTSALAVPKIRPGRIAYPFTLGIASGDPSPDGVVLWTRLAVDPLAENGLGGMPDGKHDVEFQVAEDVSFSRIVRRGTKHARQESGYSIHVELTGLQPGREYYYRFRLDEHISPVGRTLTAPAPGTTAASLTMAFASCSNYPTGFFTAYKHLADEMPDLVLHLGDYQYEYIQPAGNQARRVEGPETTTLAGYRQRHAQYKTDPDLQAAHLVAPWLVVNDDHEVENNFAGDISENNDPVEVFRQRRAWAYQAYYENMPLRRASTPEYAEIQLYRRIGWGNLASFHMLDTRQFRSDQACGDGTRVDCGARLDPVRSITGLKQERWLLDGLRRSPTTWDILGQQVFFSQRDSRLGEVEAYSMDSWDGYVASRERIMKGFGGPNGAANPVVLTGDVHTHWASDIKADFNEPDSKTLGVELVCTSVTSGGNGSDMTTAGQTALTENPHIKFFNSQRGYVVTKIDADELRADFKVVPFVTTPGAPVSTRASFVVEAGNPGLNRL